MNRIDDGRLIVRTPAATAASAALVLLIFALAACASGSSRSGSSASGATHSSPSTATAAIAEETGGRAVALSEERVRNWLAVFASDSMLGRAAGTPGNYKATEYLAAEARRLGLEPAGENGTYFQEVPLVRIAYDEGSSLRTGEATLRPWTDYLPRDQGAGARAMEGAEVVFGGVWGEPATLIPPDQTAGKVVLLKVAPAPDGSPGWAVTRAEVSQHYPAAAGIAIASLEAVPPPVVAFFREPLVDMQVVEEQSAPVPAFFYVTSETAQALLGHPVAQASAGVRGKKVSGRLGFVRKPMAAPARNVVAVLRGSDPALRGQYVAIGAHNDHEGVLPLAVDHDSLRIFNQIVRPGGAESPPRPATPVEAARIRAAIDSVRAIRPARADSIMNGADDDGSGSMALLGIAEALQKGPARPRRSVLFVWHTAEELGLQGARWFTDHPTVPRDSIVAQLNIDMIGRGGARDTQGGGPGYLQLIGSRRLSTELGDIVETVNREGQHGFDFDYQYDADGHPQNFYCRSDHYMYARYGIPIVFFSTGGHVDYHQPTDETQYIDHARIAQVGTLVKDVALAVANLDHRLVVDKPKPDPNAPCQQ